jgi:hypothetical protein
MYDPPGYLWVMAIAGIIAILAATCVVLYGGAMRAGLDGNVRGCWPGARPSCSAAGSPPVR